MSQVQLQNGLLNEHEVAVLTKMSVHTLRHWRVRGIGPKYRKIGFSVRYALSDVSAWIKTLPTGGGKPLKK